MSLSFLRSWPARVPLAISRGIQVTGFPRGSGHVSSLFWDLRNGQITARGNSSNPIQQPTARNVNNHGETILVNERPQLPGYTFVPFENKFMLRQCRRLMRASNDSGTVFVQHAPPQPPKELGPELGIYVPREVVEKVSQEFTKLTALLDSTIWTQWQRKYPQMPAADRMELQRLVSEKNADAIAKFSTHVAESTLWGYVSRTYTSGEHLVLSAARNPKVALQMREKIDSVLESWRG
ncbi:hypothetical protein EMCG_06184 [[Emmonsia] crescens]|uniref:Uncharacterized protein n=1 Tax=[Emmonsia] crescens TaxID=73230 RepID=A0A0G2IBU1_9EURO|nr:hypothetical protein EMCG_06184 [Emmonsia crescens UAMH 3008]